MILQAIGLAASVIGILGFFAGLARWVFQLAARPKGVAYVLTGLSLMTFTTLAAVVVGLFLLAR